MHIKGILGAISNLKLYVLHKDYNNLIFYISANVTRGDENEIKIQIF